MIEKVTFVSHHDNEEYEYVSPDEFEDYLDVDALTVDSTKGAPE